MMDSTELGGLCDTTVMFLSQNQYLVDANPTTRFSSHGCLRRDSGRLRRQHCQTSPLQDDAKQMCAITEVCSENGSGRRPFWVARYNVSLKAPTHASHAFVKAMYDYETEHQSHFHELHFH